MCICLVVRSWEVGSKNRFDSILKKLYSFGTYEEHEYSKGGGNMSVIDVNKKEGESNESLMRRFTRRVQSTGMLNRVKKQQFKAKKPNKRAQRLAAIRRSKVAEEREFLRKIGKLDELLERGRGRGRKGAKPAPRTSPRP